jgi:hypothetical protein
MSICPIVVLGCLPCCQVKPNVGSCCMLLTAKFTKGPTLTDGFNLFMGVLLIFLPGRKLEAIATHVSVYAHSKAKSS